jgi:hydroxyethylthiazole kinase
MFKEMLNAVREKTPLIHHITNYVTVNDVANLLIACGAAPIMADDLGEVEDITSICGGLNLNIGTLNQLTIPAMLAAGKKANALQHPVLLDPVGAGASRLRTETALDLLKQIQFAVLRGNISEIKTLALGVGNTRGVDANAADAINENTLDATIALAKQLSAKTGAIVVITGPIDVVANSEKAYCIRNGHAMMSQITGSGCQLSALVTAFVTANPEHPLEAVAAAVSAMGLCGEIAFARLSPSDGNASYRNYIIDAMFNLKGEALEAGARYEIR